MSEIYLGNLLADLDIGEPSLPVSGVYLKVDGETGYMAGDESGLVIECECPWGSAEMAYNILAKMKGFVYEPFSGTDALLDPAAELGDAITVGGHYGILATLGRNLDRQSAATVGAPGTDEIEDEYPYKTKQRKQTDRVLAKAYSRISKTAEEIRLEVAAELDEMSASFTVSLKEIRSEMTDGTNGLESKITQTASSLGASISSVDGRVTSLSADLDGIETRVGDAEGNISSLKQTATSITVEVGSVSARLDELEGLTVTGSDGVTKIKGGSIETSTLYVDAANINGKLKLSQMASISFGDLSDSDEIQEQIDNAGGLNADEVTTLISSTLVQSPTIKGGEFFDTNKQGRLTLSDDSSRFAWLTFESVDGNREIFSVGGTDYGGTKDITIMTFAGQTIFQHYANTDVITMTNVEFSDVMLEYLADALADYLTVTAVFA